MIRHETVRANGLRFHVAAAGDAKNPLVLCLHGFPEGWYSWRHQLEALSDRFLVAAPDLRGYGETEKPPRVSDYRIDALADDVAGLVRALGHERAFVVGHDWGGAVAWHTAAAHPEVVERLAILNCPHPYLFAQALSRFDLGQWRRSSYMLFFQIPGLPEALFPAARLARVIRRSTAKRGVLTDEDVAAFEKGLAPDGTVRSGLNYYRATARSLARPAERRRLFSLWEKGIEAPTLIVWGEKDAFLGAHLLEGHERLAKSSLAIRRIPDCAHWVQQEAPGDVNAALRSFFA